MLPGSEKKEPENFPFDSRDGKKTGDQADKQLPQPRPEPAVDGKPCEEGKCDNKKTESDTNDQMKWPWEASKPKILIISLKESAARRNFMQQQCNAMQQSCTFIDAVTGHDLSAATVDDVAHHAKMRLSRNEVGCFFSHKACWQKIVEEQLPFAIVVEDDVTISKDISYLASLYIPQLEILDPNWDILYLGFNHDVDFKVHFDGLKAKKLPMPPVIQANIDNPKYWVDQTTEYVHTIGTHTYLEQGLCLRGFHRLTHAFLCLPPHYYSLTVHRYSSDRVLVGVCLARSFRKRAHRN